MFISHNQLGSTLLSVLIQFTEHCLYDVFRYDTDKFVRFEIEDLQQIYPGFQS